MQLKRNEFYPFLKRTMTSDEKWVVYNNVSRTQSWFKHDETPQITSGWYSPKADYTINSDVYCQQLDKLNIAINERRPELINRKGVIFHQTAYSFGHSPKTECLVGNFWCMHYIALALHRQTTICFCLCRTSWMVKLSRL